MHSFKKALYVSALFIISIGLASLFLACVYYNSRSAEGYVYKEIKEGKGTYDTVICGTSQGAVAISPSMLDSGINVNSFNISTNGAPLTGRLYLCRSFIEDNPVKTVILDVRNDCFASYNKNARTENILISERLERKDIPAYLIKNVSPDLYFDTYNHLLTYGFYERMGYAASVFIKDLNPEIIPDNYRGKGFFTGYEAQADFDTEKYARPGSLNFDDTYDSRAEEALREFLSYCMQNGIRVIVVGLPEREVYLAQYSDIDVSVGKIRALCEEYGASYLNFNLFKDKDLYFKDEKDYKDDIHLTTDAAYVFTPLLCETIGKTDDGADMGNLFYESFRRKYAAARYPGDDAEI